MTHHEIAFYLCTRNKAIYNGFLLSASAHIVQTSRNTTVLFQPYKCVLLIKV